MNITTMSTYFLDTLLGYEDIGNGIGDTNREAKEALVLMAVGMKESWKMPVSFHLTRGVTAEQQKTLIMAAIDALREQNIHVRVVTFDGAATNMSTAKNQGAITSRMCTTLSIRVGRYTSLWMHATCSKSSGKSFLNFQQIKINDYNW